MENIIVRKASQHGQNSGSVNDASIDALQKDTVSHMLDVSQALLLVAARCIERATQHDKTKLSYLPEFHSALISGNIKESDWYKMHITKERHHLSAYPPPNVNIIDLIECICDCSMAGLARSGEIYDLNFPPELLQKVVDNTVEMLKENSVVVETNQSSVKYSYENLIEFIQQIDNLTYGLCAKQRERITQGRLIEGE